MQYPNRLLTRPNSMPPSSSPAMQFMIQYTPQRTMTENPRISPNCTFPASRWKKPSASSDRSSPLVSLSLSKRASNDKGFSTARDFFTTKLGLIPSSSSNGGSSSKLSDTKPPVVPYDIVPLTLLKSSKELDALPPYHCTGCCTTGISSNATGTLLIVESEFGLHRPSSQTRRPPRAEWSTNGFSGGGLHASLHSGIQSFLPSEREARLRWS
mmetsp:Transcript_23655/g.51629  ORF Transcript_23655/g.51629 Transcript_23655/m.51629 type:complete len:212 (-) Transcript_23655:181-816(-)